MSFVPYTCRANEAANLVGQYLEKAFSSPIPAGANLPQQVLVPQLDTSFRPLYLRGKPQLIPTLSPGQWSFRPYTCGANLNYPGRYNQFGLFSSPIPAGQTRDGGPKWVRDHPVFVPYTCGANAPPGSVNLPPCKFRPLYLRGKLVLLFFRHFLSIRFRPLYLRGKLFSYAHVLSHVFVFVPYTCRAKRVDGLNIGNVSFVFVPYTCRANPFRYLYHGFLHFIYFALRKQARYKYLYY